MLKPAFALFAATVLALGAPAAPAAPPSLSAEEAERARTWLEQVGEAMTVHAQAMAKLGEARPMLEQMRFPDKIRSVGPAVRAALSEAREGVRRSDSMLASISSTGLKLAGGITPEQIVAEARSQNAKGLAALGDFESLIAAAERGDRVRVGQLLPKVMEASFLLIDGQALLLRNRQAAVPVTASIHQALGVSVQLYRAMGAAGRAWVGARQGEGAGAVAHLRERLGSVARESRDLGRIGRENLASELATLDSLARTPRLKPKDAAAIAASRAVVAEEEKVFAIADELAQLVEASVSVSAATLAAQPTPELLGRLVEIEARLQGITAAQVAAAAKIGR